MPTATPANSTIRQLFDRLAPRYDLFNRVASLGMDESWRERALRDIKPGMSVLDLGCGTGDLALLAARRVGPSGQVLGLDFSEQMLNFARHRLEKTQVNGGSGRIRFVQKGAEELPVGTETYDAVVSAFVLRNLYERIDPVLSGVLASLNPGGLVRFLDFTEPDPAMTRALWRFYMNGLVSLYGAVLFGKDFPFFYMARSAQRFVKPAAFLKKLSEAGFVRGRCERFMMGSIVLYEAERP